MKIAIISPWAVSSTAVGGTERFIIDLAESLHKQGNTVDVYMFDGISHLSNHVRYLSIDLLDETIPVNEYTLRAHLGDFSLTETYSSLATAIESRIDVIEYDVIHLNTQLLLRAWQYKRRIFTIHTNPFEFKQAWGEASYETMLGIAKEEAPQVTFTAPSQYYADMFAEEIGTEVTCIPHAIDPSRLVPKKSKSELTMHYALDASKSHILLPSRLEPAQKQPWLLFDALQHISLSLCKKIEIISSGVDPQYQIFKKLYSQQANRRGVDVHFVKFDDMSDAYAMADVVVLPSKSESFGYAALEALTLGIPALLNDIPTFREIAANNESACFFRADARDLARLLETCLNEHFTRITPDSKWTARYSIDSWVKEYEELFA